MFFFFFFFFFFKKKKKKKKKTQVATVVSYYKNWMSKWPTVFDLAKADIEVVFTKRKDKFYLINSI